MLYGARTVDFHLITLLLLLLLLMTSVYPASFFIIRDGGLELLYSSEFMQDKLSYEKCIRPTTCPLKFFSLSFSKAISPTNCEILSLFTRVSALGMLSC